MRFVPYGQGKWFQLKPLSKPDREEKDFLYNRGEWSEWKEKAFQYHLTKYIILNKFYARLNGAKYRMILRDNPFWYGRQGMEKVISR